MENFGMNTSIHLQRWRKGKSEVTSPLVSISASRWHFGRLCSSSRLMPKQTTNPGCSGGKAPYLGASLALKINEMKGRALMKEGTENTRGSSEGAYGRDQWGTPGSDGSVSAAPGPAHPPPPAPPEINSANP